MVGMYKKEQLSENQPSSLREPFLFASSFYCLFLPTLISLYLHTSLLHLCFPTSGRIDNPSHSITPTPLTYLQCDWLRVSRCDLYSKRCEATSWTRFRSYAAIHAGLQSGPVLKIERLSREISPVLLRWSIPVTYAKTTMIRDRRPSLPA